MLIETIEKAQQHRQTCSECLTADLLDGPPCDNYRFLVALARELMTQELEWEDNG